MLQYSADKVEVSWLGIPDWNEGLAEGTFIREAKAADNFRNKPNGYGGVVPLFDPNISGALTMLFDRESVQNSRLVTFANLDLATLSIAAPMMITDSNTGDVRVFNSARLARQANYVAGTGPSVVPWVFIYAQAVAQVFGFHRNAVGS